MAGNYLYYGITPRSSHSFTRWALGWYKKDHHDVSTTHKE